MAGDLSEVNDWINEAFHSFKMWNYVLDQDSSSSFYKPLHYIYLLFGCFLYTLVAMLQSGPSFSHTLTVSDILSLI